MNEHLLYVGGPNRKSRLAKVRKTRRWSTLPSLLVLLILTEIAAPRLSAQGLPGISTASLTFGSQVAGTTSSAQPSP